jgi:4-hydroxybenzoate polyprenyltransferase
MTARRRRALASAVAAVLVAILCAALSSNVDGGQRTLLLVLTFAWLAIAAGCVVNALRTAAPAVAGDEGADRDAG